MLETVIIIIVLLAIFAVPITALIREERFDPPAWEEVDTADYNQPEITKDDDPTKALEFLNKHRREIIKLWSLWGLTDSFSIELDTDRPNMTLPDYYRSFVFSEYNDRLFGHVTAYKSLLYLKDVYTDNYLEAIDDWVTALWNDNHNPESEYLFNLTEEEVVEVRQKVLFNFLIETGRSSPIADFIHETLHIGSAGISPGHLVMVDAIEEVVYNETLERLVAYTSFLPRPHFFQLAHTPRPELIVELLREFKSTRQPT